MTRKEFFNDLTSKRTSYADMIQFCCDNMILNNDIFNKFDYFDLYSGCDYDEDTDEYEEVYQYYIIGEADADRLAEYTNEIVYYNDELDMYLLGVTHFGTSWSGVPANWKDEDEIEELW